MVFREVYCFLGGNEGNAGWCGGDGLLPGGFEWVAYFAAGFVIMFILVNAALLGPPSSCGRSGGYWPGSKRDVGRIDGGRGGFSSHSQTC